MSGQGATCHVCGRGEVSPVPGYGDLRRITSDCRLWERGGTLGMCRACGTVQKNIDQAWRDDAARIYRTYEIYHQGGGTEQPVFEQATGAAQSRSAKLLERVRMETALPSRGRLLDIGCGNGGLLRSFAEKFPEWSLAGTELEDKYRAEVESIPEVEAVFTCPVSDIPGVFDVITMVHSLEHIIAPVAFLAGLKSKLAPGGLLVVEVPDFLSNPFDLLIADHCSHFTNETLRRAVTEAGFAVRVGETGWIAKETTLIAENNSDPRAARQDGASDADPDDLETAVSWLRRVVDLAKFGEPTQNTGIFGTSIAGTWLFGELAETPGFFVDEDSNRAGGFYLGRPVHHPARVPPGADVIIALPWPLCGQIADRLARPDISFVLPPGADGA